MSNLWGLCGGAADTENFTFSGNQAIPKLRHQQLNLGRAGERCV